jgi:hypothetical protein
MSTRRAEWWDEMMHKKRREMAEIPRPKLINCHVIRIFESTVMD